MLTSGEVLKNARLKQHITLNEVEKRLKIRKKNLEAIEENRWDQFHSKIYIVGIIKNYARLLGVDEKQLLAFFRRQYVYSETAPSFSSPSPTHHFISPTKKIVRVVVVIIVLFFLGYFGYQLTLYFSSPPFTLINPQEEVVLKQDKIELVAQTSKESLIYINSERVYQDDEGMIHYQIPLVSSQNEVIIRIVGPNGRERILKKIFRKK